MTALLSIDIVIPTYTRSALLKKTLASIAAARKPEGVELGVIVVDNNSKDDTKEVVHAHMPLPGARLRYLFEGQQGRSAAINAGIRASSAELIGMVDDDEEIDADWICQIARNFRERPELDFLGGPCLPQWNGLACPSWLPRSTHGGIIGWIVPADVPFDYGTSSAYMVGGNAVVRRSLFDRAGLYDTNVGRTGKGANGGEDLEIFGRFIAAGAKGRYCPDMKIYHFIPAERLSRRYFRKRSFWDGVSFGFISRAKPEPVPHLAGIPRCAIRSALEGLARKLSFKRRPDSEAFADELRLFELAGRAYGRFVYSGL